MLNLLQPQHAPQVYMLYLYAVPVAWKHSLNATPERLHCFTGIIMCIVKAINVD